MSVPCPVPPSPTGPRGCCNADLLQPPPAYLIASPALPVGSRPCLSTAGFHSSYSPEQRLILPGAPAARTRPQVSRTFARATLTDRAEEVLPRRPPSASPACLIASPALPVGSRPCFATAGFHSSYCPEQRLILPGAAAARTRHPVSVPCPVPPSPTGPRGCCHADLLQPPPAYLIASPALPVGSRPCFATAGFHSSYSPLGSG